MLTTNVSSGSVIVAAVLALLLNTALVPWQILHAQNDVHTNTNYAM